MNMHSSLKTGIDHADVEAPFTMESLFVGHVDMIGYVVDWKGSITRRFAADAVGRIDENGVIVIDEDLRYLCRDEQETRTWRLTPRGNGYKAETEQLVGAGTITRLSDQELEWSYDIMIPVNGRQISVRMVDQMVGLGEGRATALTKITKFGLPVGKIVSSYTKRSS